MSPFLPLPAEARAVRGTRPPYHRWAERKNNDVPFFSLPYSYPGDYVSSAPTAERMAETIEKFEEDIYGGYAVPKGRRRATVRLGEAIDVREQLGGGRARAAAEGLTVRLEERLGAMVGGGAEVD